MSTLAPVMEGFFTERLLTQRRASAHTIASYRDAFRLLLGFAQRRTGKANVITARERATTGWPPFTHSSLTRRFAIPSTRR